MEPNSLQLESKIRMVEWFRSEDGQLFVDLLEDMHKNHLETAEVMYSKVLDPNQQIAAQVNQATGIKEVLDFIKTMELEVKEHKKKEEEESSEK